MGLSKKEIKDLKKRLDVWPKILIRWDDPVTLQIAGHVTAHDQETANTQITEILSGWASRYDRPMVAEMTHEAGVSVFEFHATGQVTLLGVIEDKARPGDVVAVVDNEADYEEEETLEDFFTAEPEPAPAHQESAPPHRPPSMCEVPKDGGPFFFQKKLQEWIKASTTTTTTSVPEPVGTDEDRQAQQAPRTVVATGLIPIPVEEQPKKPDNPVTPLPPINTPNAGFNSINSNAVNTSPVAAFSPEAGPTTYYLHAGENKLALTPGVKIALGRSPVKPGYLGLPLSDREKFMSRTHLLIDVNYEGITLTDVSSSGTVAVIADRAPFPLTRGYPFTVTGPISFWISETFVKIT